MNNVTSSQMTRCGTEDEVHSALSMGAVSPVSTCQVETGETAPIDTGEFFSSGIVSMDLDTVGHCKVLSTRSEQNSR